MEDVAFCVTPVFSTVMVTVPVAETRLAGKVASMLVPVRDVTVRGTRVCPLKLPYTCVMPLEKPEPVRMMCGEEVLRRKDVGVIEDNTGVRLITGILYETVFV